MLTYFKHFPEFLIIPDVFFNKHCLGDIEALAFLIRQRTCLLGIAPNISQFNKLNLQRVFMKGNKINNILKY